MGHRGATFLEIMIGVAVFSVLMIATLSIMRIGMNATVSVESRGDVQRALQRFSLEITQDIKRASRASVGVFTSASDYRWAIWMKSPMNDHDCMADNPDMILGRQDRAIIGDNGSVIPQRYILYYVARMARSEHDRLYPGCNPNWGSTTPAPDVRCPHKYVVRKELFLTTNKRRNGPDAIGLQSDSGVFTRLRTFLTHERSKAQIQAETGTGIVFRSRVVLDNLMSMEMARASAGTTLADPIVPNADGDIILFDVKVFRSSDAVKKLRYGTNAVAPSMSGGGDSARVNLSGIDAAGQRHTAFSVLGAYRQFTVQVDNRVVPENP